MANKSYLELKIETLKFLRFSGFTVFHNLKMLKHVLLIKTNQGNRMTSVPNYDPKDPTLRDDASLPNQIGMISATPICNLTVHTKFRTEYSNFVIGFFKS